MKSLFKFKKLWIISASVMLPVAGITIADPLLTQQHSTSVKQIEEIQGHEIQSQMFSSVKSSKEEIPTLPEGQKQEPNKIYLDSNKKPTVKWENAKITDVHKELNKLENPKPEPVKPQVTVTIIKKDDCSNEQKPTKPQHQPKTLLEKILSILQKKGDKKDDEVKKEIESAKSEFSGKKSFL